MSFLQFSADHIFTGTEILDSDFVLITDQNGIVQDIIPHTDAGEDVQLFKGILTPGFINCHCHLELSHMKGLIPEKTGLVDFVFKVVTERHFNDEEILVAITRAENEMLANGIVAAGDICNNTLTLAQKLKVRLAYYNFIEVSGWHPQVAETRFHRSKAFYDAFVNGEKSIKTNTTNASHSLFTIHHSPLPTSRCSLVPHAPYSVSGDLWHYMQPFFTGKTVSIHNQETAFEDDLFISNAGDFIRMYEMMKMDNSYFKAPGKSSLQSYFQKLSNAQNVMLVHNTFIKEEDLFFVNDHISQSTSQLAFFCLCINANLYIENAVPPVDMLIKNNCTIVLGTDSLASNHSLNLLDEMKSITHHFPHIELKELLTWATINGAKALQMNGTLGSFEKGKQPGIVLIDKLENHNISRHSTVKRIL